MCVFSTFWMWNNEIIKQNTGERFNRLCAMSRVCGCWSDCAMGPVHIYTHTHTVSVRQSSFWLHVINMISPSSNQLRSQETIWTSAGLRLQPPTGEIVLFSFQAGLPRTGVMSHEWRGGGGGGGGEGGGSRVQPVSLSVTGDKVWNANPVHSRRRCGEYVQE